MICNKGLLVFMPRVMSLSARKRVSEITDYLATAMDCPTYLARLTSLHIIAV